MMVFYLKKKIRFRCVLGGLILQFMLGYFVMRSNFGYNFFKFIGNMIQKFLFFTDNGTRLVFGDNYQDHFFAFKVYIEKNKYRKSPFFYPGTKSP